MSMWWKILLAGLAIFAIDIGLVFIATEIRDFFKGEGHYKEKEGGEK